MSDKEFSKKKYIVGTYVDRQINLVRGEGVFLFDEKGGKYLDLMSNYGVNIFGYNYSAVNAPLLEQMTLLPTLHGSFTNSKRSLASQMLVERCGEKYCQVFWSNSGAEAIESALKFAVLATHKKRFIICKNGYHGKTLGALSATSGEKYKKDFLPLLWEFVEIPFNDVSALENAMDENTAGFIVEPIQGEGGINVPDSSYLSKVRALCDRHDVLLIIDEIQTGVGRTGTFLASQKEKVSGDILCLGKGLAGGIPVGATIVSDKVASAIPKHIHTSTFGGNPLASRGVIVVLETLTPTFLEQIKEKGIYFKEKLNSLNSKLFDQVLGEGLMLGLRVKDKRNDILKKLQEVNVLVIPSGENVVRFLPPFIVEQEQIDDAIIKLQKILTELE